MVNPVDYTTVPEVTGDDLMNNAPFQHVVQSHDAILPRSYNGIIWGVPNIGNNVETENAAMAI